MVSSSVPGVHGTFLFFSFPLDVMATHNFGRTRYLMRMILMRQQVVVENARIGAGWLHRRLNRVVQRCCRRLHDDAPVSTAPTLHLDHLH